jgi:hypothetical protein
MVIEYGASNHRKTWRYKFEPPMYAGQARKRLEAMHQECRTGLGLVSPRRLVRSVQGGKSGALEADSLLRRIPR